MLGSRPSAVARAHASATAAIVTHAIRLLQSFAAWPAPGPPTCTGRPSARSSGSARAKSAGRPPTMIVRVADSAPRGPHARRRRGSWSSAAPSSREMNATRAMSLRGRGRELAAELAETRQRPAARRERDPDHDLVRARGVGDPQLESLVVRADAVVVLVLDREVDRRAGGAAFLRRGQKRGPFDRVANPVAEAEVVDDRRAVLDLAVEPDECPLAVALRLAVEELERTRRQECPERLAVLLDQRLEVFDVARRTGWRPRRPPPRCGPGARPCVCPRGGRPRRP